MSVKFLSLREIIRREIVILNEKPVKNSNTVRDLLSRLGVEPIKKGRKFYYVESSVYKAFNLSIPKEKELEDFEEEE